MPVVGHPRVAHGPEQDRVEFARSISRLPGGRRHPGPQVALGPPVEGRHADDLAGRIGHRGQRLRRPRRSPRRRCRPRARPRRGGPSRSARERPHHPAEDERGEDEGREAQGPEAQALSGPVAQQGGEHRGHQDREDEQDQEVDWRSRLSPHRGVVGVEDDEDVEETAHRGEGVAVLVGGGRSPARPRSPGRGPGSTGRRPRSGRC